jgi:hypothetical protein
MIPNYVLGKWISKWISIKNFSLFAIKEDIFSDMIEKPSRRFP